MRIIADGTLRFDTKIDESGFENGLKNLGSLIERLDKSITELSNNIKSMFTGVDTSSAEKSTNKLSDSITNADENARKLEDTLIDVVESASDISQESIVTLVSPEALKDIEGIKESIDKVIPSLNELDKEAENINMPDVGAEIEESNVTATELLNTFSLLSQYVRDIPEIFSRLKNTINDALTIKVGTDDMDNMSSSQIALQNNIRKTEQEIQELAKSIEQMETMEVPTDEFLEIQNQIVATEKKLNSYLETESRMKETGAKLDGNAWKNLQYKIEDARNTITHAKGELEALKSSSNAFTIGGDTAKLDVMKGKYTFLNAKLNEYKLKLSEVQAKEREQVGSGSRVSMTLSRMANAARTAGSALLKVGKTTVSIANGFKNMAKGISNGAKTIISKVRGISNIFKLGQKSSRGYGNSLKNFFKSMLLYQGLSQAIRKLASTMWSYLKTNDTFSSSLAQVKGNLLTAFQPIYEAAMPAINALMNILVQATGALAQFTSALFGKSVKSSQAAAKAQYQQVQALKDTSKAAKDANKQLSNLDELNVITDSDSSQDSGSSGTSVTPDFNTDIDTTDGVNEFAEKLKEAWRTADFTEIGSIIAGKINTGLSSLEWNDINATTKDIAQSIYTGINGFVKELDWELLGQTMGNGVNTAVSSISTLLTGIDWSALGSGLGTSVESVFKTINWDNIGQLLSDGMNSITTFINNFYEAVDFKQAGSNIASGMNTAVGKTDWSAIGTSIGNLLNIAIESAYGFITTFDFKKFGSGIATTLNNAIETTDWITLAKGVSSLAIGLLDTLSTAIREIDWQLVGSSIGDMISNIDWLGIAGGLIDLVVSAFNGLLSLIWGIGESIGKNIAEGLADGISLSDIIKNAATWVNDHIFKPIVDNIKKLFGIHSPSTVMHDIGTYLMQGMINGITSLASSVKAKFKDLVKNIKEYFTNLPTWFETKFNSALTKIKTVFSTTAIKTHFNSIWSNIKSCFSNVGTWFKDTFTTAWTNVKNVFSTGGKIYDGIKEGIGDTFKSVVNKLIDGINSIISIPFTKINSMISTLQKVPLIGGALDGFSLTVPKIPKLATGTVVPKNYGEFMAILGDNKRETEIVSPLSTIEQAVDNALNRRGGAGNDKIELHITLVRDGKKEHEQIMEVNQEQASAGRLAFAIS